MGCGLCLWRGPSGAQERSESGDSKRYLYASEVETVSCQREMLQKLHEEHTALELLVGLDDESIIGVDLLNDIEVATAIASDDAMSNTSDTSREPATADEMMLDGLTEETRDLMSCLPESDELPGECRLRCEETGLLQSEDDFFDALRHWVRDEVASPGV